MHIDVHGHRWKSSVHRYAIGINCKRRCWQGREFSDCIDICCRMALSDKGILRCIDLKTVVVEPFERLNLSTSSYDVTLGPYHYRQTPLDPGQSGIYNIWSEDDVKRCWGESRNCQLGLYLLLTFCPSNPHFRRAETCREDGGLVHANQVGSSQGNQTH